MTMHVYPSISRDWPIIRVFARPIFVVRVLMKNAVAMNPSALQMKMIDTAP